MLIRFQPIKLKFGPPHTRPTRVFVHTFFLDLPDAIISAIEYAGFVPLLFFGRIQQNVLPDVLP